MKDNCLKFKGGIGDLSINGDKISECLICVFKRWDLKWVYDWILIILGLWVYCVRNIF